MDCKKIGKYIKDVEIPIPLTKSAINTIISVIKKLIKLLVTFEIGNISLGKYTFLTIPPLLTTQAAHCKIVLLKYVQGINATIKKTV